MVWEVLHGRVGVQQEVQAVVIVAQDGAVHAVRHQIPGGQRERVLGVARGARRCRPLGAEAKAPKRATSCWTGRSCSWLAG